MLPGKEVCSRHLAYVMNMACTDLRRSCFCAELHLGMGELRVDWVMLAGTETSHIRWLHEGVVLTPALARHS